MIVTCTISGGRKMIVTCCCTYNPTCFLNVGVAPLLPWLRPDFNSSIFSDVFASLFVDTNAKWCGSESQTNNDFFETRLICIDPRWLDEYFTSYFTRGILYTLILRQYVNDGSKTC